MGVKGLWQLLAPVGKPVSLDSLEGKILAVDVSIWLNKALKGMRDRKGNHIYNAHLVLMFHRICKLLFYGVKPVFVFDGGVPDLKKNTLKARRDRRMKMETKKSKVKEILVKNLLQTKALEEVTGYKSTAKMSIKDNKPDLFELPSSSTDADDLYSSSEDEDMTKEENWLASLRRSNIQEMLDTPDLVNMESKEFKELPAEVKHELLMEMQDYHRKRHKYRNSEHSEELPEESGDFSSFQLGNLMKRGKITHKIDQLRREMNSNLSAEFLEVYSGNKQDFKGKQIDSKKIASSSRDRYVLIKNPKSREENVLFHTNIETNHFSEQRSNKEENDHFRKLDRLPSTFNAIRKAKYNFPKFLSDDSSDDEIANLLKKKKQERLKNTTKSFTENKSIKNVTDIEYMSEESSDSGLESEEKNDEKRLCHREKRETLDSANEGSSSVGLASVDENKGVSKTVSPFVNNEIQNINKLEEKVVENKENLSVDRLNPGVSDRSVSHKNLSKNLSEENGEIQTKLENRPETLTIDIPDMEKLYSQSESTEILSPVPNKELNLISPLKDKQYVFPSPVAGNLEELASPASVRSTYSVADKATEQKEATSDQTEVSQQTREDLEILAKDLEAEQAQLTKEKQKQTRQAATISAEMYQEVQEMLQLFGIPYLVSPMEAEAQCAYLDWSSMTDGSITDDSDIFLFGGKSVYKNVFTQKKVVEIFTAKEVEEKLYLPRDKLVAVAFLTGSDYTEGIQGVGGVTAMEILHEFHRENPKETLTHFRKWMKELNRHLEPSFIPGANLVSKLKVDYRSFSREPNVVLFIFDERQFSIIDSRFCRRKLFPTIGSFASEKLTWLASRTEEILNPVISKVKERKQRLNTLDRYFKPKMKAGMKNVSSKRLQKILDSMKKSSATKPTQKESVDSYFPDDDSDFDFPALDETDAIIKNSNSKLLQSDISQMNFSEKRSARKTRGNPSSKIESNIADAAIRKRKKTTPDDEQPGPSKSKRPRPRPSKSTSSVSSNPKVQAKKLENIMKAAAETLKPLPPFVRTAKINNTVIRRLTMKEKRPTKRRKSSRKDAMATLLNQIDTSQAANNLSSGSDSE